MRDVMVLCYHAVSPSWAATLSVTPDALERQVTYLVSRGWHGTTFSDAVTGRSPGKVLAVTFDDAFGSVKEYAEPILSRHGVPATVFAPTEFMDGGAHLEWPGVEHWMQTSSASELEAMDWSDLRRLCGKGWEIGSHTCTHPRLTRLDEGTLAHELTDSLARCAEQLDCPCQSIAYPYGDVNDRVVAAAAAAGYLTGAGLSSDLKEAGPNLFPRVGIYNSDDWSPFRLKVARPMRRLRATSLWLRSHPRAGTRP